MRIEPFIAEHWLDIEWQESQKPWAHLLTREVADVWEEFGDGLTLLSDSGEVIASAAIAPTRVRVAENGDRIPDVSHACAAFSPRFSAHIKLILRAIRTFLGDRPERKITMHVWPADEKAARFARRLGFVFERAEYVPDVKAFLHLYARVRN